MNNITSFEIEWVTLMISLPIGVVIGVISSYVLFFRYLKKIEQKRIETRKFSEISAAIMIKYKDLIATELEKEIAVLKAEIERLKVREPEEEKGEDQ